MKKRRSRVILFELLDMLDEMASQAGPQLLHIFRHDRLIRMILDRRVHYLSHTSFVIVRAFLADPWPAHYSSLRNPPGSPWQNCSFCSESQANRSVQTALSLTAVAPFFEVRRNESF